MQLRKDLWIEGAYYIDFDTNDQLRIVGPNNHLHYGSVDLYRQQIDIDTVHVEGNDLVIGGRLKAKEFFLRDPVMAHVQKVRHYVERPGKTIPKYSEVIKKYPAELSPNYIAAEPAKEGYEITYRRLFQNHWYGVRILLAPDVTVHRQENQHGFALHAGVKPEIGFSLRTDTDIVPKPALRSVMKTQPINTTVLGKLKPGVDRLLDHTAVEITHLIKHNKTSGFDYGTVFPRDWMESADLGLLDLEPAAIAYMYHKAFEYVNPQGIGWHENIVGEFEFEKKQEANDLETTLDDLIDRSSRIGEALKDMIGQIEGMYVVRNMIDIEPRYILGLEELTTAQLKKADLERAKQVARYIVLQAQTQDLITFKRLPTLLKRHKHDEYFTAGNWRDSSRAFKKISPVIAPYDVNAVFYPKALQVIARHYRTLGINRSTIEALVEKWSRVKNWYRFTNPDGRLAYALALHDVKGSGQTLEFKRLEVNHLDEAYDLFYGHPEEADVVSFCQRLLDPDYFYTASGPLIVGRHDGYSTKDYHGQVIWTKQTAFAVAGLAKCSQSSWSAATQKLISQAIKATALASIQAFIKLEAVPELHYDQAGQPHFYNDQTDAEGPMNQVQLWSAIGARRIIRTYIEVMKRHGS